MKAKQLARYIRDVIAVFSFVICASMPSYAQDKDKEAMLDALKRNDVNALRALLDRGVDPDLVLRVWDDGEQMTALKILIYHAIHAEANLPAGHPPQIEQIRILLEHGARTDGRVRSDPDKSLLQIIQGWVDYWDGYARDYPGDKTNWRAIADSVRPIAGLLKQYQNNTGARSVRKNQSAAVATTKPSTSSNAPRVVNNTSNADREEEQRARERTRAFNAQKQGRLYAQNEAAPGTAGTAEIQSDASGTGGDEEEQRARERTRAFNQQKAQANRQNNQVNPNIKAATNTQDFMKPVEPEGNEAPEPGAKGEWKIATFHAHCSGNTGAAIKGIDMRVTNQNGRFDCKGGYLTIVNRTGHTMYFSMGQDGTRYELAPGQRMVLPYPAYRSKNDTRPVTIPVEVKWWERQRFFWKSTPGLDAGGTRANSSKPNATKKKG